jgi:hypothetical protein
MNGRWSRRAVVTLSGVAVGLTAMTGVGLAYWTATDSTHGASAVAAVLPKGGTPTTSVAGRVVTVSFPQAVTSAASGTAVLSTYTIGRYDSTSATTPAATFSCVATVVGSTGSCQDTSAPDGSWYYSDAPTLANWRGEESVRVAAVVNMAGATVAVTSPTAGSTVGSATPTISGAAAIGAAASSDIAVRIYSGSAATGTPVQTASATATDGIWSLTPATLADGTYTVVADQQDSAGHVVTSPPVTFGVDATGPAISINTPAASALTPALSGSYGTAAGDQASVAVQLYSGSTPVGGTLAATLDPATHTWSVTPPALPDGTYTATATQTDATGNIGTTTSGAFTVDSVAPPVTLAASAANGTATFSGTSGTATGDSPTVTVDIYPGTSATGTPVGSLTTTASSGAWSVSTSTLGSGRYTAIASQRDAAGNAGVTAGATFTIAFAPALTLNPVGVDDRGFGGYVGNSTPTFTGSAGTATGDGVVLVTVTAVASGNAVVTDAPATVSGSSWSYSGARLPKEGQYRVSVRQDNTLGTTLTSTASSTLVLDETSPGPTAKATTTRTSVKITGTAGVIRASATASADATSVSIVIVNDDTGTTAVTATAAVLADGTYTFTNPALPTSKRGYSATITQTDAAGHSGSAKQAWA